MACTIGLALYTEISVTFVSSILFTKSPDESQT